MSKCTKNVLIEKNQLRSALRRVDKYILENQTIAHLEDEHPRLKIQPKLSSLFRALFGEYEVRGTFGKPYSYLT